MMIGDEIHENLNLEKVLEILEKERGNTPGNVDP
jgi:NADH:ubiquinone oxidoreductase subunit E